MGCSKNLYDSEVLMGQLKANDKNCLISSTYIENITPNITPATVAKKPIVNPVKKNDYMNNTIFDTSWYVIFSSFSSTINMM